MKMVDLKVLVVVLMAAHTIKGRERPDGWVPPDKGRNEDPLQWGDCDQPCGGGQRDESTRDWTIGCNNFPCVSPLTCECGDTDLLYILDNTGSITQKNFWIQKQFSIDIAKGLAKHGTMGDTSVGLVTFDNSSVVEFEFGDGYGFSDVTRLEDKIWNTPKRTGHTNTAAGLNSGLKMFNGQQSSNKKVAILFTDGASNIESDKTIPTAEKLHAAGVGVFVIGIGDIKEAELKGIASKPTDSFYFYASDFDVIESIVAKVMQALCCAVPPPTCTAVSQTPCSVTCDGGTTDLLSTCEHYGFGGVVVKTEDVMEKEACNEDPCCPATVKCTDQDTEHIVGHSWKMECTCSASGKSVCMEAAAIEEPVCGTDPSLGCGYRGDWHAPGSSWVQDVSGGRQKACFCPETVPARWQVQDYCVALCIYDGKNYYDGDVFTYEQGGATIECRCATYSKLQCNVKVAVVNDDSTDPVKGCRWSGEWHAPGTQWMESVSGDRKKSCTCSDPVPSSFHISSCLAICEVGGDVYEAGETWTGTNPSSGVAQSCTCKSTAQVACIDSTSSVSGSQLP